MTWSHSSLHVHNIFGMKWLHQHLDEYLQIEFQQIRVNSLCSLSNQQWTDMDTHSIPIIWQSIIQHSIYSQYGWCLTHVVMSSNTTTSLSVGSMIHSIPLSRQRLSIVFHFQPTTGGWGWIPQLLLASFPPCSLLLTPPSLVVGWRSCCWWRNRWHCRTYHHGYHPPFPLPDYWLLEPSIMLMPPLTGGIYILYQPSWSLLPPSFTMPPPPSLLFFWVRAKPKPCSWWPCQHVGRLTSIIIIMVDMIVSTTANFIIKY